MFLAGCSGTTPAGRRSRSTEAAAPAQVSLAVADGATDVSPVAPLEISVTDGELGDVTVVDGAGAEVAGAVADVPGAAGHLGLDAGGAAGLRHQLHPHRDGDERRRRGGEGVLDVHHRHPGHALHAVHRPAGRQTVGVGMPIRVYFDDPVADKAAVESHLLVTTLHPDRRRRGTGSATPRCTSGPRSTGRPNTAGDARRQPLRRRLRRRRLGREEPHGVLLDRRQARLHRRRRHAHDEGLRRRPAGADLPDERRQPGQPEPQRRARGHRADRDRSWTPAPTACRSTPRAATARRSSTPSASPTTASSCTPPRGRSAQQGNSNVSHGCINLSTERAAWFFDFSQPGDVVEVKNSIGRRCCR